MAEWKPNLKRTAEQEAADEKERNRPLTAKEIAANERHKRLQEISDIAWNLVREVGWVAFLSMVWRANRDYGGLNLKAAKYLEKTIDAAKEA